MKNYRQDKGGQEREMKTCISPKREIKKSSVKEKKKKKENVWAEFPGGTAEKLWDEGQPTEVKET